MNRKKIFISILIFAIIGAFIAYKMYNKPHVNIVKTTADFTVSANKILNDFTLDENAANIKYLEKIIEVKGVITDVKTENKKGIITLKTNDDFGSVLCHLNDADTIKANTLTVGNSIVLKGICTGFLMDVILVKCKIIN